MDQQAAPGTVTVANYQNAQDAIFNGPVALARGRQARHPQAKTVSYTVASLEAFETSLREFLTNPPESPEHTDCQLSFWTGTTFLVSSSTADAPLASSSQQQQQQQQQQHQPHLPPRDASQPFHAQQQQQQQQYATAYQNVASSQMGLAMNFQQQQQQQQQANTFGQSSTDTGTSTAANGSKNEPRVAMTIAEALRPTSDPKDRMRKQRAIAKCCVDTIQHCDGYRYSFHNCWNSREDDSFRFSYYCNDSLLNKDRAANGKGAKYGKRATKPVYDCRGVLSIKFSATKSSLDVFYKHLPVHKTYEERAPPPRKDSRRRKFLEENDPEALKRIQNRPKQARLSLPLEEAQRATKKKKTEDPKSSTSLESDLRAQSLRSLLELIRDPTFEQSPPEPPPPAQPAVQPQHPPPAPPVPIPPAVRQQPQAQPSQPATRKRPRNSCDVCKTKKTKCDGTRPVCQTCIDKKRQCCYTTDQPTDERRPSTSATPNATETPRPPQPTPTEISELERMKKELDEAKARIQELEDEKRRASTTPLQTPQITHVAKPPRPQPHHQPQPSKTPPQPHPHPQPRPQQRQHSRSHSHSHHQQQPQPPQPQPIPPQIQPSQPMPSPQQAMQQLQTAAQQLQTPQYANYAGNPYTMTPQQQGMPRNAAHPSQPQNVASSVQNHAMGVSAGVVGQGLQAQGEQGIPYAREFGAWSNAYYGYQSAQGGQQEGGWGGVRGPGVFR